MFEKIKQGRASFINSTRLTGSLLLLLKSLDSIPLPRRVDSCQNQSSGLFGIGFALLGSKMISLKLWSEFNSSAPYC
jgi:hypothetical protein